MIILYSRIYILSQMYLYNNIFIHAVQPIACGAWSVEKDEKWDSTTEYRKQG